MRNSDAPAFPLTEEQIDRCERGNGYEGLSKREFAIIKIMAGMAADPDITAGSDLVSEIAINWADVLFERLEKENNSD
jgi:hypothetical protein